MCHALVEGKQILDASLIANKAIDSRLKSNLPEVICNLEKEKAYWQSWRKWALGKGGWDGQSGTCLYCEVFK